MDSQSPIPEQERTELSAELNRARARVRARGHDLDRACVHSIPHSKGCSSLSAQSDL